MNLFQVDLAGAELLELDPAVDTFDVVTLTETREQILSNIVKIVNCSLIIDRYK